jgi:hypothetical protein
MMASYLVQARVIMDCDIEVEAESLEKGLKIAKELDTENFVDKRNSVVDWSHKLTGIFETE